MPITKRLAIKLIMAAGGSFVRHGSNHDKYEINGQTIMIPRHSKDLSPKVEQDIKRLIGIKSFKKKG